MSDEAYSLYAEEQREGNSLFEVPNRALNGLVPRAFLVPALLIHARSSQEPQLSVRSWRSPPMSDEAYSLYAEERRGGERREIAGR